MEKAKKKITVIDGRCTMPECKHRGTYTVPVYCSNCDWKGHLKCTLGHGGSPTSEACPACECRELHIRPVPRKAKAARV